MKLNLIIAFFLSSFLSVQRNINAVFSIDIKMMTLSWSVVGVSMDVREPRSSAEVPDGNYKGVRTETPLSAATIPKKAVADGNCALEEKQVNELKAAIQKEFSTCESATTAANWACMGVAEWGTALGGINALLPVIQGAKSQGDACKAHSSAMDIAQKALSGYNVTCGGVKFTCETICKNTVKRLQAATEEVIDIFKTLSQDEALIEKMCAVSTTATAGANQIDCQARLKQCFVAQGDSKTLDGILKQSVAKASHNFNICEGYGAQLLGSAASLMSVLKKKGDDAQCACVLNPDTKECQCQKDPTLAQCQEQLNCEDPKNAANVTCICQKAGNKIAGCPGGADTYKPPTVQRTQSNQVKGLTDEFGKPVLPAGSTGGADQGAQSSNIANTGSGNALGTGGGGGGANAGVGGGGIGAGPAAKTGKEKSSGMNANVIGGYEGGGGGFGSGYGGGNRFGEDGSVDPALAAKAKAAARDLASQKGSGLTGSGGKDHFQKVRAHYQTQKPSLLNR